MSISPNPDEHQAASHRNMIEHLSGPLSAGAVNSPVPLSPTGEITVDWDSREPLLLVSPLLPLQANSLRIEAILDPAGTSISLSPVTFAPYSEAGASLALYVPPVDANTRTAPPFTLALTVTELDANGVATAIPAIQIVDRLELSLVEGVLGKMIVLLGSEKAAMRRQAREIAAIRQVDSARDDALDRIGAGLGVARFTETLAFQAGSSGAAGEVITQTRREPDSEYRPRLELYQRFTQPTRPSIAEMLNGEGNPGDPNRGLISQLGFTKRFDLVEEDNEFAVAIHLVGSGAAPFLANFLDYLRRNVLVLPANTPQANLLHSRRFLPQANQQQLLALRGRLRQNFQFPSTAALAPELAEALDRVGRCRRSLGGVNPWPVQRAQDETGGSRYTLGLGVDVAPLAAAELNQLRSSLLNANRAPAEPEIEALLKSMQPETAARDPEGRWLLEPCGIRTVHRVNTTTLYLSHFPTFGLVITGQNTATPNTPLNLEARYHAPGDPGKNVVLVQGIADAAAAWVATGAQAFTQLSDVNALTSWDQAAAFATSVNANNVFRAAGLPVVPNVADIVARLKQLPGELHQTIVLPPALSTQILAGAPQSVTALKTLTRLLEAEGLPSALPLVSANNAVIIVVGAIGLPEAGINMAGSRATGFRWYVAPIQGAGGTIQAIGSRNVYTPSGNGLAAIVVIGYARRGLTDPYEYRVDLPDGALLNLLQYEFLMNLLERAYPIGVEINTFSIRKRHVDLNNDGAADPLRPQIFRSYRPYQRRRQRGVTSVTVE